MAHASVTPTSEIPQRRLHVILVDVVRWHAIRPRISWRRILVPTDSNRLRQYTRCVVQPQLRVVVGVEQPVDLPQALVCGDGQKGGVRRPWAPNLAHICV